ncbi:unnamed protein product [Allacma fusca]|uniref:CRAL-TRIO domain-containing protein n=1 Tax=Allacma fusca TaxID=39272 RepID=A0A8J2PRS4_9HEXA|nr:unnamed protein product [Allacma fusca]
MDFQNMSRTEIAISQLKYAVPDLLEDWKEYKIDLYLLRWLKAQNMDVKKAEKMMRESLNWRKENKCEQWLEQSFHPGISSLINLHKGRCKNGAPIACIDAGTADLRNFIDKFGKGESYKFVMQNMIVDEITTMKWNEDRFLGSSSDRITESSFQGNVLVIDLKNVSYRLISSMKAIQLIKKVLTDYLNYIPELGSELILVNCNGIILPIINMFNSLMEGRHTSVTIYGTNEKKWKEVLLQRADPDQLPESFGGTVKMAPYR